MSNKRTFNEDSSEEDTNNPLPAKKAATSSPASEQCGTCVPKGRRGWDLPKISAFPANTPKFGGRGSSQGDKSPARAPRFYSGNTWLCVHWQWNTLEWCQLNALQASPVVHLVTPLSFHCSLTMKHTRVVSTKCTPGFACRAFSDTTLVCFIVNEHTTKCSCFYHTC